MLKLVLCFYVMVLAVGALAAVFRFFLDVMKWHDKEKKITIDDSINDIIEEINATCESEVNYNEISVNDITV